MKKIASQESLLSYFRSVDRDEVQVSPDFKFPMAFKDSLTWLEPSGHRAYLLFEDASTGQLLGIVFQRTHGATDTAAAMCQWCHTVKPGPAVGLLTAAVTPDHRVGIHLCSDLSCGQKDNEVPGVHELRESLDHHERMQRIRQKMTEFARRHLF